MGTVQHKSLVPAMGHSIQQQIPQPIHPKQQVQLHFYVSMNQELHDVQRSVQILHKQQRKDVHSVIVT